LASILQAGISARLRHYRPQGRKLLLVLKLLLLRARLGNHGLMLELLLGMGMLLCLLLAHLLLLLVGYLLLDVLVLEGALSVVVRATRRGMLMLERMGSRGS
jgi:hypothetical protein